jgi:hypothetical protein
VDLCKVALWIEGHTKGKPLTFLDHRIRCGDSLVGVFDLGVLKAGVPNVAFEPVSGDDKTRARHLKRQNRDERGGYQTFDFKPQEEQAELATYYSRLATLSDDTPEHVRQKAAAFERIHRPGTRWWEDTIACHLWTAAFFSELTQTSLDNQRVPTTESVRRYLQTRALDGRLVGHAWALASRLTFFHWPLEFPEVFAEGGFDVVLGNPPFMGGLIISGNLGDKYRHWLETAYTPYSGTADLCAPFYRRVFDLLKPGGRMGMVATNTLGQGDTRESGLAVILREGGMITFARRFIRWPGAANVEVNLVAIHKPHHSQLATHYSPILDGQPVPFISSRLDAEPEAEPKRLPQTKGRLSRGQSFSAWGLCLSRRKRQRLSPKTRATPTASFLTSTARTSIAIPSRSPAAG